MDPIQALENIASFQQCIQILEETVQVSNRLLKLVATHKLTGKRIHDANIVATMLENGITRLVTLNPSDFSCFDTLSVEAP
jgi:predicted nucleic acid-binding protein